MRVRASQGDTLDAICQRYYGRTAGVTELALTSNPGLADHGPILPMGLEIELPDIAPQAERRIVQLWD
ncbi:tail protein X [Jeongeupia chitinilytica]|uniref:Tail protein X n=1 Tax=Jeongeupia chitinilytica TaxID=1041641 RepID=A0ABQ3H0I8_9NEIS|nr:tail protein X [Jeongeupia chitinilytica]GHD59882.1 tail protein X [Jeongeupia chitinilytica]